MHFGAALICSDGVRRGENDRSRWYVLEDVLTKLDVDGEQRLKEVRDAELELEQEKEKERQSKRQRKKEEQIVERKKRKTEELEAKATKQNGLASFWAQ